MSKWITHEIENWLIYKFHERNVTLRWRTSTEGSCAIELGIRGVPQVDCREWMFSLSYITYICAFFLHSFSLLLFERLFFNLLSSFCLRVQTQAYIDIVFESMSLFLPRFDDHLYSQHLCVDSSFFVFGWPSCLRFLHLLFYFFYRFRLFFIDSVFSSMLLSFLHCFCLFFIASIFILFVSLPFVHLLYYFFIYFSVSYICSSIFLYYLLFILYISIGW